MEAGLIILLRAYENDLDYLCKGPVQGFKVLLHHPAEIPRLSHQYLRVPLNEDVVVAVKPHMMTTSENLRSLHPNKRQCFFPEERSLRYFRVYTQNNCELECLANHTLSSCGCVKFSMPRANDEAICGSGNNKCVAGAQDSLMVMEVERKLKRHQDQSEEYTACDCLPACTSIQYDSEISQGKFNWERLFMAFKANFSEHPHVQMARLSILFKDTHFATSKRSELYNLTDFLATCGGLLCLFLGASLLSIVEILYFATLRLFCTVAKRPKKSRPYEENNGMDVVTLAE